jgi:hypothetical protein
MPGEEVAIVLNRRNMPDLGHEISNAFEAHGLKPALWPRESIRSVSVENVPRNLRSRGSLFWPPTDNAIIILIATDTAPEEVEPIERFISLVVPLPYKRLLAVVRHSATAASVQMFGPMSSPQTQKQASLKKIGSPASLNWSIRIFEILRDLLHKFCLIL